MTKYLAGFFLMLAGCTTLTISPARASSLPGEFIKLSANQTTPIAWTASAGSITSDGIWTAPPCPVPAPVTVVITAVSGSNSATSQIIVEDKVSGITVTPSAATVLPNGTVQFRATIKTFCFPAGLATSSTTLPVRLGAK